MVLLLARGNCHVSTVHLISKCDEGKEERQAAGGEARCIIMLDFKGSDLDGLAEQLFCTISIGLLLHEKVGIVNKSLRV